MTNRSFQIVDPGRASRGFTLLELLFVIAIISVLAGIAVPNFLEAQIRAKVGRTRTDLAATSMALNRYYIDYAAYPPNNSETRRYIEAALQNPVFDSTHTSQPVDAKIPWWDRVRGSGDELHSIPGQADFASVQGVSEFPALDWNANQLTLLTTPVSYLGTSLSSETFRRYSRDKPFGYLNVAEVFSDDGVTSAPGLWGAHLTSATYYYLVSVGPDGDYNMYHPLSGPWIGYDPTNGTASSGDIFVFEGHTPDPKLAPEDMRPDFYADYYW